MATITRRDFLKYSAAVGGGLLLGIGLFDLKPIKAYADASPPVWGSEAITVCGYCSVGCSMVAGKATSGSLSGYVTYVQGNPDSPINKGALCSKGSASAQFSTIVNATTGLREPHPGRLTQPMYRAAGGTQWTPISWPTAISDIAAKVKATRGTLTEGRTETIATLGGSSLNNEAAYLITKLNRALGVVYLETQARN